MALVVVDAGVVIAVLDPDDAHHRAGVNAFTAHAADRILLPASAYAETMVAPARAGRADEARERLAALAVEVPPLDADIAEEAARLRAAQSALRLPDALVLASAELLQADVVLTTDRRWSRFPRVELVA